MTKLPAIAAAIVMLAWALASAALAREAADPAPAQVSELRAGASETERAEALQAMTERLERDFNQARSDAVAWIRDPALPPEFRSSVLRAAISAARTSAQLDFDAEAAPAYEALAERLPAGLERSRLHQTYGNLNLSLGRFGQAESLFRQALSEAADRDIAERANLKGALGVALAQQGRLDDALAAMIEAHRLYEETEAGPAADLLRNIGGLSVYLKNWEQAIAFSHLALEKLGPNHPQAIGIYSNLAAALTEQGNLEAALEALETGMAVSEAHGQPNASVISNLGYVLRELDRPQEALAHFERAAELNRAASDTGSLAISMKNIGETLIRLEQRQQADAALQQSLAAYREADIKPKRLELYPVLVENLEQLQRYPEALAMMREYRDLTEELASADAQARVVELQTAFDLERKERELAESERERLAGQAQLATMGAAQTRQRHLRTLLMTGVAALGLILLLLLRLLQLRTRANRLLAEKNAEIDKQHKALGHSNALLQRQSVEDELTRLGNRRSIRRLLESELPGALAKRPALLILADIDRFKGINDQFGHPVGDRVLARFAQVLKAVAGPDDVIARWGGEEFLWLVAGADMSEAAERCRALAERLRATEFEAAERSLSITCSMGVATLDLSVDDPQAAFDLALKIADEALYEAKDAGRDGWVGFERRSDDPKVFEGSLDIENLVAQRALIRQRL
ncbi:MAG: diguanylate cyclase [Xanthomonadales bacterium]|nr:diguanylate cyclase [Xanthomonadales bacterium]